VTDLHQWITQQLAGVERIARQAQDDVAALLASGDVRNRIAERHITLHSPEAVLRRCEADRRILDRHRMNPDATWLEATACYGCGSYGDMDLSNVDNLNDCPELLDLAYAHGITDEILASLDRPQLSPSPPPHPEGFIGMLRDAFDAALRPTTPMADVPPALRGPQWREDR
jgi:hypothetical protein